MDIAARWEIFRRKVLTRWRGFAGQVSVLVIANGISAALNFAQGVIVARILGPQFYGVAALIMSYPNFLFGLLNPRSADASVKYLGEFDTKGEKDRALAVCKLGYMVDLTIAVLTFIVVAATARWAEQRILHQKGMAPLIVLYAAAFLPRALGGMSRAVLAVFGRFSTLAWVVGLNTVVRTALVMGLVFAGFGIAGVVWGNMVGLVFYGLVLGGLAYPMAKKAWGASWLSGSLRNLRGKRGEIVRFLFYNDLNVLLGIFVKQFDLLMLGYFRGPQEVGYYRLAKSVAGIVGYLVEPLQSVTYPRLARLWGGERREEMKRFVRQIAVLVGIPLGGLSLIGILFVPLLTRLLVGKDFMPAVLASQILLAGSAVWVTFFWLRPLFLARGLVRQWVVIAIIVVMLTLAGLIGIVPRWGYLGMAWWWFLIGQVLGHGLALGYLAWVSRARRKKW